MSDENLEQQTERNSQVNLLIDNLTLFDDDLMSLVFDGNIVATELLLRIILNKDDIKVLTVVGQRELENPVVNGRNIRLDIFAQDSTGRYYDIEVQRSNDGASYRRARFHSSMLDTRMLKAGEKFKKLMDSYIIFITQNDVVGSGLPLYHVSRIIEETQEEFNDGSHIVYVNGSYKGDDSIGKLIHDFGCKKSEEMFYPELAVGVKHFKETEGGRKIMCEAVEEYANKQAQEAAKVATEVEKENLALKMLKAGKYELEEIASLTELSVEQVKLLEKNL
jgi:hypothetical protein